MSWYDYVPGVAFGGAIKKLSDGDYKGATEDAFMNQGIGGNIIKTIANGAGDAFSTKDKGYEKTINDLGALADKQRAFQMEGLNRAENYYLPAQQRLDAIYGPPGSFRK